jgi:hypothetical protein
MVTEFSIEAERKITPRERSLNKDNSRFDNTITTVDLISPFQ